MVDLEKQPLPPSCCPECGADPLPNPRHKLTAIGYAADDVLMTCSNDECQNQWLHGIPIGKDDEYGADLVCEACGGEAYVHKIRLAWLAQQLPSDPSDIDWSDVTFELNVKCGECYHFFKIERDPDRNGVVLIGHSQVTGSMEDLEYEHY